MIIKRDVYLNRLIDRKNNGLIKVITGIRRCGKSFLLFNLFKSYLLEDGVPEDHIIELNFDSFENEIYRDANKAYDYLRGRVKDSDMYYMLLDEIQLLDKFESILNSFLRLSNVDIYVTGSNAKFLSNDIITEFRGRGDQVHVYPLSFEEFFNARNTGIAEAFNEYITYGGLPLIMSMKTHEQKAVFLHNLFIETYLKDIVNRNKVTNDEELQELISIISSSIGSLTNPNKLSNTFKSVKKKDLSAPTINKYLSYLIDSFLINKANKYDVKGKKYIDSPYKCYFSDLGIRNSAINFRQSERTHLLENLIYNELLMRGFNVDVGTISTVTRESSNKQVRKTFEIDFVCNLADKKIYIQSVYALPDNEKYLQEARPLMNIEDSFKKVIITYDQEISHYTADGILIINIYEFLLNKDALNY